MKNTHLNAPKRSQPLLNSAYAKNNEAGPLGHGLTASIIYIESLRLTELKDDRMENYGAYIGFISK